MRQMRAATLTGYIEVARHVGLDPFELLRSYEISPTFLDDPENRHAAEPIVELLEESARQSNCGAFGLLMAECRSFAELGPLCLLLERLPNVRSVVNCAGVSRFVRFHFLRLVAPCAVTHNRMRITRLCAPRKDLVNAYLRRQHAPLCNGL